MAIPSGYSSLGLIGFTDKGDYNADTNYVQNDLCHNGGKIWKCKLDNTIGQTPAEGTYWTVFVDPTSSVSEMEDVTLTSLADGQELTYDATANKWKNTSEISNLKNALSNEVVTRATLGAHNLLPLSLATIKSLNTAGTWSNNKYTASNNACEFTINTDSKGNVTSIGVEVKAISASDMGLALSKENFGNADFNTNSTPTANGYTISYGDTNNNFRLQYLASSILTRIVVLANTPVSTKTMYPMIRLASDTDTTYRPYVPTNAQLLSYKDNGVLGAKNLLPNTATTQVVEGVTYTVNSDKSVTANGTAGSSHSLFPIGTVYLKAGTYLFNGNPNGLTDNARIDIYNAATTYFKSITTNSDYVLSIPSDDTYYVRIVVIATKSISNARFYPMIRLATDTDPTYQPYAKTNQQLTADVKVLASNFKNLGEIEASQIDNIPSLFFPELSSGGARCYYSFGYTISGTGAARVDGYEYRNENYGCQIRMLFDGSIMKRYKNNSSTWSAWQNV